MLRMQPYYGSTLLGAKTDTSRGHPSSKERCLWTEVRLLLYHHDPPPHPMHTQVNCPYPMHTPFVHSDPYVKVSFTGRNQVIAHSGHKTQVIKKVRDSLSLSLSLFTILLIFLTFPPPDPSSSMEPNTSFPGMYIIHYDT